MAGPPVPSLCSSVLRPRTIRAKVRPRAPAAARARTRRGAHAGARLFRLRGSVSRYAPPRLVAVSRLCSISKSARRALAPSGSAGRPARCGCAAISNAGRCSRSRTSRIATTYLEVTRDVYRASSTKPIRFSGRRIVLDATFGRLRNAASRPARRPRSARLFAGLFLEARLDPPQPHRFAARRRFGAIAGRRQRADGRAARRAR